MNNATLQKLVFDVINSSPCRTEVDIIGYEERVRGEFDYQEQVDTLEIENMGLDKCIRRLSKDAKEAIDECKFEADGMAQKMIFTVKLLQSENVQWQVLVCYACVQRFSSSIWVTLPLTIKNVSAGETSSS